MRAIILTLVLYFSFPIRKAQEIVPAENVTSLSMLQVWETPRLESENLRRLIRAGVSAAIHDLRARLSFDRFSSLALMYAKIEELYR